MISTRARLANIIGMGRPADGAYRDADTILAEHIVIPKAELPHTTYDPKSETDRWTTVDVSGPITEAAHAVAGSSQAWEMARHWAAIALSAEVQEENTRNKRRDELAAEFTAVSSYGGQLPYTQKLIDRIIDVEQQLEARP